MQTSSEQGMDATGNKKVVLVVDDEPTLREAIVYNIRREGWEPAQAEDGVGALAKARELQPDLVILDVMLPGMDGLQVCRTLRIDSNVPILFLSARGEEIDRILGLELGGDDYLTKPFAMRELIARVRAMLRRAEMGTNTSSATGASESSVTGVHSVATRKAAASTADIISFGDLSIDIPRRSVRLGANAVALKPKEFDLLAYLMRHPGLVLSRDALLREVWGYDYPVDTRTIDVHVRWLRSKLQDDPVRPQWIETIRGYGYRFVGE